MKVYNTPQNNKQVNFKSGIYKGIASVKENAVSSFQPLFIKTPHFPRDVFSKHFAAVPPSKRTYLHKFANLHEHYALLYDLMDLKVLESFSLEKLKSLFMIAFEKDSTGLIRFSPDELRHISLYSDDTLKFIKPFARQQNRNGVFNYGMNDILKLAKFSDTERQNAIRLFKFNLPAGDLIAMAKDKNADIAALKNRLETVEKLFAKDIDEMEIKKYGDRYVVTSVTQNGRKVHKFVFDNKFKQDPRFKSEVDFDKEQLRETNIFKRLNPFKSKPFPIPKATDTNLRVSKHENLYALDTIQESIDYIKRLYLKAYKHNFYAMYTGKDNFYEPNIKLPKNMLVNCLKQGAISNDDLIKICMENAGLIPESDLNYFALNKIKITPFDTDKYLEIRYNKLFKTPVEIGSTYYKKVFEDILKTEKEKLGNIKAQKRMIIADGLPGAGKSTVINAILQKDKTAYYTPDSDDIKAMFKEVYKNGENADLVHEVSGHILKTEILQMVFEQGKNLIYQTTGSSVSINKIIRAAKKYGYDIDFIHITTPKDISAERSVRRFEQNGRFIDPYVIMSIFNKNNKEKDFSAKIFSHNPNIRNAYVFENGKLRLVKDGKITDIEQSL